MTNTFRSLTETEEILLKSGKAILIGGLYKLEYRFNNGVFECKTGMSSLSKWMESDHYKYMKDMVVDFVPLTNSVRFVWLEKK